MRTLALLTLIPATCLLTACNAEPVLPAGQTPAQLQAQHAQVVDFNYTLEDAMYVYNCAYYKENNPSEKERLNNGRKLLALFVGKEAEYKASVDQDRANRHRIMNDLALKYNCY